MGQKRLAIPWTMPSSVSPSALLVIARLMKVSQEYKIVWSFGAQFLSTRIHIIIPPSFASGTVVKYFDSSKNTGTVKESFHEVETPSQILIHSSSVG